MRTMPLINKAFIFLAAMTIPLAPTFADSPLSKLSAISSIRSIEIEDNWMGLSEFGPVGRHYFLKPAGESFSGKSIFSLGGGTNLKTKEVPLTVPKEIVQKFLTLLSQSVLEKGVYQPKIDHTDDYPSVHLLIETDSGKFDFFSQSQGELAVPWGIKIGADNFVINMKAPGEALALIHPYLKEDGLKALMDEYRARK